MSEKPRTLNLLEVTDLWADAGYSLEEFDLWLADWTRASHRAALHEAIQVADERQKKAGDPFYSFTAAFLKGRLEEESA